MKKILSLIIVFYSLLTIAQTSIKGIVKDNLGQPIPGANVVLKGTDIGVSTDINGKYIITTTLTGSKTIRVTFIGYKTYEENINLDGATIEKNFTLQEEGDVLDEVVLTASSTFRSQKNAPLSISSLKQKEITKLSANSQADIIRSVPGVTAEGGGGETATNVFVRGLPSGGQYVFNPLQYDGMPLMSTFGLNSSAHDVYARPDIGFKGFEFVRGGAAVLYGAGSVAGILNYTSKTGDTDDNNIINVEWANKGRVKTDFYTGGTLGNEDSNTFYAFTGFVRYDEGPIVTGLPTKGAQFRGNIKKKFENGSFTIHGQYINDNAQFFLPLPLNGSTRSRLKGNDGEDVFQLLPSELANTSFRTPTGVYNSPIEDGVSTKGGYVLTDFNYNFNDNLKFKSKIRFAEYQHNFALYIGGNGANNNPITLNEYINNVAPANTGFSATYQGGNTQVNGNDLVIDNLHIDRYRPMTDYSGEASFTQKISTDTGSHSITLGTFLARTEAEDINFQYRVLTEFNNDPRLINLSYTDATGNNVIFSEGGLYNRIGITTNRFLSQNRSAFYLTDEMVLNKWRFDIGFRVESTDGVFRDGNIVEDQVYTNSELTAELANVNYADGTFTKGNASATDWAVSLAGLYELNEATNLYANFSKGYFFPQLRSFRPLASGDLNYDSEQIIQFETGVKFANEKLSGSFAGYYVGLNDRIRITQGFNAGQLVDLIRSEQNTATLGVEATWDYKIIPNFNFRGTLTYQHHEITKNIDEDLVTGTSTTTNEGNKLARQPNFLSTLSLNYDNKKFDGILSLNYTGSKFAADNNNVELDPISIVRLGAGYTFNLNEEKENLRLGFSVFNLLDTDGVTEGDPRNVNQAGDAEFFFGRPILPRRLFITATFNF